MAPPQPSSRRPATLSRLHDNKTSWIFPILGISAQDELLQHSRYIRDSLAPRFANEAVLPPNEMALLSSVMNRIAAVPMTMSLLRYSRIEKALMTLAYTSQECWPVDIVGDYLI